jgi:hypothetical protein
MSSMLIFVFGAAVGGVIAWLWSAGQARAALAPKIANLLATIGGRDTTITELRSQVAEQAESARAASHSHLYSAHPKPVDGHWHHNAEALPAANLRGFSRLRNLAASLRAQGDLAGARAPQEEVLTVSRRVLGADSFPSARFASLCLAWRIHLRCRASRQKLRHASLASTEVVLELQAVGYWQCCSQLRARSVASAKAVSIHPQALRTPHSPHATAARESAWKTCTRLHPSCTRRTDGDGSQGTGVPLSRTPGRRGNPSVLVAQLRSRP